MQVKEVFLKNTLEIENEKTNKLFVVIDDKNNTHVMLMKEVFNEYEVKLKSFIMSFNQFKLVVNQYELINELLIEDVLDYLKEKGLLNQKIKTNHHDLIQDLSYGYNLSKRYTMINRNNELLKEIFMEVDTLPYPIENSENVLSDVLLMNVFPNYKILNFVCNIEQLIHLPKNELVALIDLNIKKDIVLDDKKFLKLIRKKVILNELHNYKYVKRIDISPFTLFEHDGKLADFLKSMDSIPYKETTECHFYLKKDYLMKELFNHINVNIDDFLIRTYKESELIEPDLRYVFFVEQLKRVQDGLVKLESLKGYSNLYKKEKEFLFSEMNKNEKMVSASYVIDCLNKVDETIRTLIINYPTSHLDEWMVNKQSILNELYYVKPVSNHKEFYEYAVKHLLNNRNKYLFKEVDVDYIVIYNRKKQEILLEIEKTGKNYQLKQIYAVKKDLTTKEKDLIIKFCQNNNIKLKQKRYLLLM